MKGVTYLRCALHRNFVVRGGEELFLSCRAHVFSLNTFVNQNKSVPLQSISGSSLGIAQKREYSLIKNNYGRLSGE